MPGLNLHASNQLEKLMEELAVVVDKPKNRPFDSEVIVVQSRGMARWVSLQIARLNGICMNCAFPFPRVFINGVLKAFFPEMPDEDPFSGELMLWKIHDLLPALARRKEFELVRGYIEHDDSSRRIQLAEKIAHLFDQYMVYRPELIRSWELGEAGKDWQAILWRELAGKKPPLHLVVMAEMLDERMSGLPLAGGLPERVSIFGIASLPPIYLRVFFALARHCEVNLFLMSPSREYFAHDLTPKARARLRKQGKREPHADTVAGNPLLASWGRLNRDFTELRLELDERTGFVTREQPERFADPPDGNMLGIVQRDILHATGRGGGDEAPRTPVGTDDTSIAVHACHSPMREIEVLYDQLLAMFNNDHTLTPRDIIVMAPDIEKYAPFIHAVFGAPEEPSRHIPYSVADRRPRGDSGIVETFLSLLELPGGRCTAAEIFALLDRGPVRARFQFTGDEIAAIREWIAETGIRWGVDGAHRREFGVPPLEENTWRSGFRRMLLGYAMSGEEGGNFECVTPFDIEGDDTEVMGRFLAASEALFAMEQELQGERTLAEWAEVFGKVVNDFLFASGPEDAGDLRFVQGAIDRLREIGGRMQGEEKAGFRAVRHFLGQLLDETEQRGGFFTGGVTFCALKPMRSIPARVICLIGMDDQAFPRQQSAPAFDLMARDRQCGDRSPRDDDRYSFLEAVVSAREKLYISYLGRSVADNGEMPPSVLVSELLDYLDQAFEFSDGKSAAESVVAAHRLQAFSPAYFDRIDSKLFSFSSANAAAANSMNTAGALAAADSLPKWKLPAPPVELRDVELRELVDFFSNPSRNFLLRRLGIKFREDGDGLEESEPFDLNQLEQYDVKQELMIHAVRGVAATSKEFTDRALLPLGGIGEGYFHSLNRVAGELRDRIAPLLDGFFPGEMRVVDLKLGERSITGKVGPFYGNRIVHFRCAKLKASDWLRAWLHHLVQCAALPGSVVETVLVGEDDTVAFPPVSDGAALLADLLKIQWQGMERPIPFFPKSAFAYACAKICPSPRATSPPIKKARTEWEGSRDYPGEKDDHSYSYCFPTGDPFDAEFEEIALAVFAPMLENAKQPEGGK